MKLNFGLNQTSEIINKDVVIVGNGPSAISLSFFLSGNLPYFAPEIVKEHPDELLRARFSYLDSSKSLLEYDLHELSLGLDGRSLNPVSLLFDTLQNPGADLGLKLPSMLKFKHHKEKEVSHIVLGKSSIGGSWTKMPQDLRTLSLSSWMSLPGLNFDDWQKENDPGHFQSEMTRAEVGCVAKYYSDYVKIMKLEKYFKNDTVVFKIAQVKRNDKSSQTESENAQWLVHSFDKVSKKVFVVACKRIVLANGASDLANHLGVKGESNQFCVYDLPSLEKKIETAKKSEKEILPVCVCGAGLSAADAVIYLRKQNIKAIHVYRSIAGGFLGLPPKVFPEYCSVLEMMKNPKIQHDLYKSYPDTIIKEVKSSNGRTFVTVQNILNGESETLEVSFCGIFIGSRPDLQFLNSSVKAAQSLTPPAYSDAIPENFFVRSSRRLKLFCEKFRHLNLCRAFHKSPSFDESPEELKKPHSDTLGFCEDSTKPLDVRTNVLAVNKFNELLNVPKGVYAVGPLVGDNFVRFIPGGSLLICSEIHKGL